MLFQTLAKAKEGRTARIQRCVQRCVYCSRLSPIAVRKRNGRRTTLASKTKVPPTKGQTIPRRELLSASILARQTATVEECLFEDEQEIFH